MIVELVAATCGASEAGPQSVTNESLSLNRCIAIQVPIHLHGKVHVTIYTFAEFFQLCVNSLHVCLELVQTSLRVCQVNDCEFVLVRQAFTIDETRVHILGICIGLSQMSSDSFKLVGQFGVLLTQLVHVDVHVLVDQINVVDHELLLLQDFLFELA